MKSTICFAIGLALASPMALAAPHLVRRASSGSGELSYYGTNNDSPQDQAGSCGIALGKVPGNFAAMNSADMSTSLCGKCAKLTYKGKSTIVTIVDTLPSRSNGLDININSFGDLVGGVSQAKDLGIVQGATWSIVDCSGSSSSDSSSTSTKKSDKSKTSSATSVKALSLAVTSSSSPSPSSSPSSTPSSEVSHGRHHRHKASSTDTAVSASSATPSVDGASSDSSSTTKGSETVSSGSSSSSASPSASPEDSTGSDDSSSSSSTSASVPKNAWSSTFEMSGTAFAPYTGGEEAITWCGNKFDATAGIVSLPLATWSKAFGSDTPVTYGSNPTLWKEMVDAICGLEVKVTGPGGSYMAVIGDTNEYFTNLDHNLHIAGRVSGMSGTPTKISDVPKFKITGTFTGKKHDLKGGSYPYTYSS